MNRESGSAPRARLLIADPTALADCMRLMGYSRVLAHTPADLLALVRERTLDADAFLIHHRFGTKGITSLLQEIRHRDERAAILVYTHASYRERQQTQTDPYLERLRRDVLSARADLFLNRFNFADDVLVERTLEVLVSTKRSNSFREWNRRWDELIAAAALEETWLQAVDRVMSWHQRDGYARGRLFHLLHSQQIHQCISAFGHAKEEKEALRIALHDLDPLFEVIRVEGVSRWTRNRLESLFRERGRAVPDLLRRLYFSGEEFPWVYVSLFHGNDVLGNISLDRRGAADPEITQVDLDGLEWFRRRVPDVLHRLWLKEDPGSISASPAAPETPCDPWDLQDIVQEDPTFRLILDGIAPVATLSSPVLITGETGSGKEILAKRIHEESHLRHRSFLAVNCAAMVPSLTNELFGSVKGAYTDAVDRPGYFEAVNGGTLFLDEIGDLDRDIQGRLLRVLETGEIVRVGDTVARHVSFRLICATNTNLQSLVRDGRFRLDLYFRIARYLFSIPPLRERPADVETYVEKVLARYSAAIGESVRLSAEARKLILEDPLPGNFRQLQSALRSALVLRGNENVLTPDILLRTGMIGLRLPHAQETESGASGQTLRGDAGRPRSGALINAEAPSDIPATAWSPGGIADRSRVESILSDLLEGRGDFWGLVCRPFREHALAREDVLYLIEQGLKRTFGSYKQMAKLFSLDPEGDYKRFMDFLRSNSLWLDYRPFRGHPPAAPGTPGTPGTAGAPGTPGKTGNSENPR